jgi:hypothetical protein
MILLTKVLIDAIPGMAQDLSWTIVNLGYMAVSVKTSSLNLQFSYTMFHHVTGVPFEST